MAGYYLIRTIIATDRLKRDKVKNENDINELLSVTIFSDAIDEMIIRSADGDVNEIDIEDLVSESRRAGGSIRAGPQSGGSHTGVHCRVKKTS